MSTNAYVSWGRYPVATQNPLYQVWRQDVLPPLEKGRSMLPFGLGRSYGDSCLNDGNYILSTEYLDKLIAFDPATGVLRCEAGVTFDEILRFVVPRGWFLPVTPGTKFVTVGGAIANDIHGKNHHRAGSFGNHIERFELRRSDGSVIECSSENNSELYCATIGGLGLTGLITWAEFKLLPIKSDVIDQEKIPFHSLNEFYDLSQSSASSHEYTVAWIDCLARGSDIGRGIFIRGNFSIASGGALRASKKARLQVPCDLPACVLSPPTIRLFNQLFYFKNSRSTSRRGSSHFEPFFYPLDSILSWNRIYGKRGFLQYQCVIPKNQEEAMKELLGIIGRSKRGSFLAVLKVFGERSSRGILSFPRPGITLALDFPNTGKALLKMLKALDEVVLQAGGALYAAKDARMGRKMFHASYPKLDQFSRFVDPQFSSSFWRTIWLLG